MLEVEAERSVIQFQGYIVNYRTAFDNEILYQKNFEDYLESIFQRFRP